jgi:hypothetical protein
VVKHPFRRGHLRDLVLLAGEIRDDVVDVGEIERALAADRYARELIDMLRQVQAMHDHARPSDAHATRRFVAWKYGSMLAPNRAFREWIPGWMAFSVRVLERPRIRRREYRRLLSHGFGAVPADSPLRRTAVGRRLGGVSRLALPLARFAYRLGLIALVVLGAWYIRRTVEALLEAVPSGGRNLQRELGPSG